MTSPLIALFTRSLREDTRAKTTYWARAGLAAFMIVLMIMAATAGARGGAPGLVFLKGAIWLQTVFLTISGLAYFASAITEEKEEETLGLLRMTNLNPLSILLGKSTSRLCGALLLIVAQLPFTLMAVTLGGVSPGQVLAAYATLGAYAFLLGNLALLASVIAQRTSGAALLTGAVLCAGWAGGATQPALRKLSPFIRLEEIFTTGFRESPMGWQVGGSGIVGVVCFLLAWAFFERLAEARLDGPAPAATALRRKLRTWFASGRPTIRRALAWKDFHFLHGGSSIVVVKTLVGVVLLGFVCFGTASRGATNPAFPMQMLFLGLLWLIAEAGFAASRICACEIRDRTLSSLALLPQSLPVTMNAKIAGFWPAAIPALTLTGLSFIVLLATLGTEPSNNIAAMLLFGGMTFGYIFAMSFLGIHLTAYLSLRMKRGALPLAIIICIASGVFSAIPLFGWFGVPIAAIVVGTDLRRKIFQRLEDLAAEN